MTEKRDKDVVEHLNTFWKIVQMHHEDLKIMPLLFLAKNKTHNGYKSVWGGAELVYMERCLNISINYAVV